jgi:hypothetical protein
MCIGAPIILGRCHHCQRMIVSLCYERISPAEINKPTERGKSTQWANESVAITTTSELLLKQNVSLRMFTNLRFTDLDNCVTEIHQPKSAVLEVDVKLRPTVSRPVRLVVRHPSGTCDQFLFLLEIFFRQLRVCYFIAPSLTRGRVCNLLLLLGLASAVPRDSRPYFIILILETSPNLEGQVPVFISPRNSVAQIYPRALGSLSVASYDSQSYGEGILSHLHTG